jgi:MoxR-like ATPase
MDGRRRITLTGHRSETVTAADGFYVIAGHNPGVHGAILTDALASRFAVHIHVTTDWDLARQLKVPPTAIAAAIALNQRLERAEIGWAPQLRELLTFKAITETLCLRAAIANLAAIAPDNDRDQILAELRHHFGPDISPLGLGRQH